METLYECATCGQKYEELLLAHLHSGTATEQYYACPRCLTKVKEVEHDKAAEAEEEAQGEAEMPVQEAAAVVVEREEAEETKGCPYYLGYLRKREKNVPIPEGCLTCSKMIECI